MKILIAHHETHWSQAKRLVNEYAESLDFDLEFQNFDEEIESLSAQYGPPSGCFLLAREGKTYVGCVGLRRITDGVCEMKRLYLQPGQRGKNLGRDLAEAIIAHGRKLGYKHMRLDTVPTMVAAQALYESVGFREIDAYRHNPVSGTTFMELKL